MCLPDIVEHFCVFPPLGIAQLQLFATDAGDMFVNITYLSFKKLFELK